MTFESAGLQPASRKLALSGFAGALLHSWSIFPLSLKNVEEMCFAEMYPLPVTGPQRAAALEANTTVFIGKRSMVRSSDELQCMTKLEGGKCPLPTPATPETVPPQADSIGPVFYKCVRPLYLSCQDEQLTWLLFLPEMSVLMDYLCM